jgi:Putative DNA-binding domain
MNTTPAGPTSSLALYQQAFDAALWFRQPPLAASTLARLVTQPGFAVYRNTVLRGCIDALQANFPAVVRVVGEEWFRAAAAVYARAQPPTSPVLLSYGDGFADFLAGFAPAADMPWLAEVARIDRLWSEAHVAADDTRLTPADLLQLDFDDLSRTGLRLHPATRWRFDREVPLYALWSCNRDPSWAGGEIPWQGEGVLLTRPHFDVEHEPIDAAGAALLTACADGDSIMAAVAAAAATTTRGEVDVAQVGDLSSLISRFLQAGAFAGLRTLTSDEDLP